MVSASRLITVGVSDMGQALALFRDAMSLEVERQGELPQQLLKAWQVRADRAEFAELSCKGYPIGRLRLVAYEPPASIRVRSDHGPSADTGTDVGPKAIDFYVPDPIADSVAAVESLGYKFRSPPVKHQIADSISEECLFSGPDGVPILLMVGHLHASSSLRDEAKYEPFSEIATISIVAGDLEKTRAFYEGALGLVALTDAETPDEYRDLVDKLTGVPQGTRVHFLLYAQEGEPSGKILLVHFFDQTGKRLTGRMRPGHLGFSLLTHDVDDIEALWQRLSAVGASIITPPTLIEDASPYKMMLAEGPNEELFEFTEFL